MRRSRRRKRIREKIRKEKGRIGKDSLFLFLALAAAGAVLGTAAALAAGRQGEEYTGVFSPAKRFFIYLWLGAAIWFSGFVRGGIFVIPFIIAVKGAGLAFTAAVIGGSAGVLSGIKILFVQNFILFFVYFYLAETGFRYIRDKSFALREYVICFALAEALTAAAVCAEGFML